MIGRTGERRRGRARARLRVAGALLALVGSVGSLAACEPPRPRVHIYGDSLAWEAAGWIRTWGQARGFDVVLHYRFGGAPCSFFDQMRADRRAGGAHAVVVSFTGNPTFMSPCVAADTAASHGRQIREVARIWAGSGTRVVWAATPRLPAQVSEDAQDAMRAEARRQGIGVADAGRYVTPGRAWAQVLPCMSGERCPGHQINPAVPAGSNIIRANDGVHFCPGEGRGFDACPYYSSGAWRYGRGLTEAIPGRG